jgi:hypothetical protein
MTRTRGRAAGTSDQRGRIPRKWHPTLSIGKLGTSFTLGASGSESSLRIQFPYTYLQFLDRRFKLVTRT